MASIHREVTVAIAAERAWDAIRDVGQIHRRLAPGFLTDCRLDGDARIVSFANGMVARELIVDLDDRARRIAWSARETRLTHHSASLQAFADGPARCRLVWIADLLPHEHAAPVAAMIEQGMAAMKRTLEGADLNVTFPVAAGGAAD